MLRRFSLLSLLLAFVSVSLFAQSNPSTGVVKGFVYDKSSGEPMIYTFVYIEGTKIGVQTDNNGYFAIRAVPEGEYTVASTLPGYDTAKVHVTVKASGNPSSVKLFLKPQDRQLRNVEVSAHKKDQQTQVKAGVTTVTPREMKLLPSSGGEPDIAQYLQVTPGVIFTGDQGGQLYIRGGAPSQTGILLDGVTIYNPFHSIGLYSVFETDAIRSVDIQTAGFNAEYGNRTSAILDIHTKDGNKNRLAGKLSASPIMARAMLEGPLVKQKKEDGGSTTFLLSLKHSYLDNSSKTIYGGFGEPFNNGLPYSFTDIYGKVSFNASNGSKLNLFGFNFDDKAKIFLPGTSTETADFHWVGTGGGATFVISPANSDALINGKLAYSKYTITDNEVNFPYPRASGIDGFEGGIDFTYFLPGYSQIKYGIEVSGFHTSLDYAASSTTAANKVTTTLDRRNTLLGIYGVFRKNFGEKLIVEPSIRLQYYSSLSYVSPEPRLGLKYNVSRNVRIKAAAGIYTQNILSTKSDRDIVNFFTGFLLSPDQTIKQTNGDEVKTNLLRAYHLLAGIEVDVNKVEFNLEPWYKKFSQLIELNRNKKFSSDPDFQGGDGDAYGLDLSAKYSYGRYYIWGVASYQQVTYTTIDDQGKVQTYAPPFDRRFNFNFLAAYTMGKKKLWDVSARYNLGSPFPFTQTQGYYENLNLAQNGVSTNLTQQNGQIGLIYASDINGGRLSWYHRLDISIKKKFPISKTSNVESTFSVTNVYNRNNIFFVDRIANTRVYQLPLFPSLNVTWNF